MHSSDSYLTFMWLSYAAIQIGMYVRYRGIPMAAIPEKVRLLAGTLMVTTAAQLLGTKPMQHPVVLLSGWVLASAFAFKVWRIRGAKTNCLIALIAQTVVLGVRLVLHH